MKNLVFVGLTSSGKTSMATHVANRLNKVLFDIDEELTLHTGLHVDDIIAQKGLPSFRETEYELFSTKAPTENGVIGTGGGSLLNDKSRSWLTEHGLLIYLQCPFDELYRRIQKREDRPFARSWSYEEAEKNFKEREIYYKKADIVVDANKRVNDVAEEVFATIAPYIDWPFEFWFRKEYEPLIRSKKLTSFVRPGDRIAPASKGTAVGENVQIRIIEKPSTPDTLPVLTAHSTSATVLSAERKQAGALSPDDFDGASPDAASISQVQSQLERIYGKKFFPEDFVTVFKIKYE